MPQLDEAGVWLSVAKCPVCGVDLTTVQRTNTCCHVRLIEDGQEKLILFTACREHYDEAVRQLKRDPLHRRTGYLGEWEPRFGTVCVQLVADPLRVKPVEAKREQGIDILDLP